MSVESSPDDDDAVDEATVVPSDPDLVPRGDSESAAAAAVSSFFAARDLLEADDSAVFKEERDFAAFGLLLELEVADEFAESDVSLPLLAPASLDVLVGSALAIALISLGATQIDSATKNPATNGEHSKAGTMTSVALFALMSKTLLHKVFRVVRLPSIGEITCQLCRCANSQYASNEGERFSPSVR